MPSGDAGKNLQTQYEEAMRHLLEGWEAVRPSKEADDDAAIRFVPFVKVGTVRVRFKAARPLSPLRYPVDDTK
jgi:hypothetical protein